ncbi:39S ribosomal protein L46, mitochondrial-like [Actinia tenebrosa]|uniref:Large ribosomal subunit protein mL46 n=1 Tax=Actinia tenebrosa TaxID=6105 RepID=A0A6P8HIA4_ACTTE|nr:39S ribosomal protein L46, mitochondrial-like [Actinia tenebrosa]
MAAECMVFRGTKVFTSLFTNRGLSFSCYRNLKTVTSVIQHSSKPHLNSTFYNKKLYSTSVKVKIETDPGRLSNIFSAVCVERLPFIVPEKTELQKQYEELQDQLELERSALSEDEVKVKKVMERKKKLTERDEEENMEIAQFEEQRKEFQEEHEEEYRHFQPGSRETDADKNNDLKSSHRKLQNTLILLLKTPDAQWEMPQSNVQEKETLRQAAERRLKEVCGSEINVKYITNAPAGVVKIPHQETRTTNKVFFYKACFLGGTINLGTEYQNYAWVTREEMKDFVKPEYYKTVSRFVR